MSSMIKSHLLHRLCSLLLLLKIFLILFFLTGTCARAHTHTVLSSANLLSKCTVSPELGQDKARGAELHPGLLCGKLRPSFLSSHLLPLRGHNSRKLDLEVALGLEPKRSEMRCGSPIQLLTCHTKCPPSVFLSIR